MSEPILTLKQLQELASGAGALEGKASRAKRLEQELAAIRIGDEPLMVAYKNIGGYRDELRSAIEMIINEHGADLLRIVEMRQAAFARDCKVKAAELRGQLATVVASEPEVA